MFFSTSMIKSHFVRICFSQSRKAAKLKQHCIYILIHFNCSKIGKSGNWVSKKVGLDIQSYF